MTSHANSPIPEATFMTLMFPVMRPSAMAVGATMGELPDVTWNRTPRGLHASYSCSEAEILFSSNRSCVPSSLSIFVIIDSRL